MNWVIFLGFWKASRLENGSLFFWIAVFDGFSALDSDFFKLFLRFGTWFLIALVVLIAVCSGF